VHSAGGAAAGVISMLARAKLEEIAGAAAGVISVSDYDKV